MRIDGWCLERTVSGVVTMKHHVRSIREHASNLLHGRFIDLQNIISAVMNMWKVTNNGQYILSKR